VGKKLVDCLNHGLHGLRDFTDFIISGKEITYLSESQITRIKGWQGF